MVNGFQSCRELAREDKIESQVTKVVRGKSQIALPAGIAGIGLRQALLDGEIA